MANLEIEGRLIRKFPVRSGVSGSGREWQSQEFVLEFRNGNYPGKAVFNVWGPDKIAALAGFNEGSNLNVSFNIASREYNGRWYTDLRAWRIVEIANTHDTDVPVGERSYGGFQGGNTGNNTGNGSLDSDYVGDVNEDPGQFEDDLPF